MCSENLFQKFRKNLFQKIFRDVISKSLLQSVKGSFRKFEGAEEVVVVHQANGIY